MSSADHEFGSQATELKLSVVEAYLRAFTSALRGKFPELWFIDAFAGTGERTERVPGRKGLLFGATPETVIRRRGSAKIAIDVRPPFDRLIFVEKRAGAVAALQELQQLHADRNIDVIAGDANEEVLKLIRHVNWRRVRAVMFLDPYGMSVDWETLKAIAATEAIDVWYLFSLAGLYRQAARRADAIDDKKRAAITRVLGTAEWEQELYAGRAEPGLLWENPAQVQRTANVRGLEDYVRRRLQTIFPAVLPPLALPILKGPQRFSLFLAISNPNGAAIGLATRIAAHILKVGKAGPISDHIRKAGISSHVRPR
jgi:three-Cys-motif partner protein